MAKKAAKKIAKKAPKPAAKTVAKKSVVTPEIVAVNAETTESEKKLGGVTGKGFMPGECGNPAGRPKKPITLLSEAIRAKLQESYADGKTYAEAIADRLCREAVLNETQFVATSNLIADRTEGKASQPVEMNINQPFANKTNAEIAAYIANGTWPEEAK